MSGQRLARAGLAACTTVVLTVVISAAEIVRVVTLSRAGRLLVSFELSGGYTPDIREVVLTGLETTFSYDVELQRTALFWFDRTIASATVAVSVRYDNLTRTYQISRLRDGRVEETRVAEDEGDVRQALTTFERLPLFSTTPLEEKVEYKVRVRAQTRPRNTWFVWPWQRSVASGDAKFTFLP